MNILLFAKMSDYKLETTLKPLVASDEVKQIFLLRRSPVHLPKVICYTPPKFLSWIVTAEMYRFFKGLQVCLSEKIDIIIGIHFYFHCIYAAILGMFLRIPYLFSIIEDPQLYRKNKIFKFFAQRAKHLFVRGSRSKTFLIREIGCAQEQVDILPDYFVFRNTLKQNPNPRYDFVFVGFYVQEKRIDILLEIFAKLQESTPNFKAALIGQGPLFSPMQQYAKKLGIAEHVDFLGFVDDIYPVLNNSRVFIMTSATEGLPTALIEAIDCGLPSIVPDVGDMTDLAIDQENAIVVKPMAVEEFRDACLCFLNNPSLLEQFSSRTAEIRRAKMQEYSLQGVASVWENIFASTSKPSDSACRKSA